MRLTVFGATGGIGTEVVRQALDAGHEVIAVVRDPAKLGVSGNPLLRVIRADVTDTEAIVPAVEATDAVVSALGPRKNGLVTICSDGTHAILGAMDKTGVRRLVVVSASGAYTDAGDGALTRAVVKPILQRLLREGFTSVRAMEREVRASGTDWTIMRPPMLTNGARRGTYRTAIDRNVGRTIARADVADAIMHALADAGTIGHSIGVGY
jgi:putative NADH-flavin reductase